MNNFSYSDLASRLKLHLLESYPPGAHLLMSELPEPPVARNRLSLNPPAAPLKFEHNSLKEKIAKILPDLEERKFLMVVRHEEVTAAESLLQAVRTKLCPCDQWIVEETSLPPKGYKAVMGTESALKQLNGKVGKSDCLEISYPEWSILSSDKKGKLELWNRLSEIR